ncbi:LuxR family transcriptional regulator [Sphingomonas donggukensis]|uniref:LuxR family transcriptional regulator n=1 Tax=Sphingomonas donggukensis TaxID=2949093 RepID=A0ABY4TV93_9SPHN|nr:LuxR family transcriptional regulator [Sphingomonas donggukensis]URW75894.1 LuxR family transcriptional regulator [Sphingomonas donggukensis]
MTTLAAVPGILCAFQSAATLAELALVLTDVSARLRFRYFAMVQHVDFGGKAARGFRLHNYPDQWQEFFDRRGLGPTDPVHRASHTTLTAFRWHDVGAMIPLNAQDREVLALATAQGLGDGITVPAHVPGELLGSTSFASAANDDIDPQAIPVAQLAGQFAFESSRRLMAVRPCHASQKLTTRQLECIMYVGRGKTDGEIAQILGLSHNTVVEHLRNARERYNAAARSVLPVRALYDGALSFADVLVS